MSKTSRRLASLGAAAATFAVLDAAWISQVALPLYKSEVPHLMADKVDPVPAAIFYPAFTAALTHFAVRPDEDRPLGKRLRDGALFGLAAYGTWSLTGKAVLKDFTWPTTLADMGWGAAAGAAMAAAAHGVLKKVSKD